MPRRKKVVSEQVEEKVEESVKITDEEISLILELIKEGKTLKQIGETLAPPVLERARRRRAVVAPPVPIVPPAPIISKIEIKQVPTVDLKIDWLVDNKRYSLGATRPLPDEMTLQQGHEQLYGELLLSMENLVNLNKDK
jgi:hypothetical protein